MRWSNVLFFCALFLGVRNYSVSRGADYSDLDCPEQNACAGNQNDKTLSHRNCQCDSDCYIYDDCCTDVEAQPPARGRPRGYMECMQTGHNWYTGVYVISRCDDEWIGPAEVKEKCEGPSDFIYPERVAPVTSLNKGITYKNLYCAQCNHAEKESLKSFRYEYSCRGLWEISQDDIMKRVTYNMKRKRWGIDVWWDDDEHPTFEECAVVFDVPAHLKNSVRFCRANIVSECSSDWSEQGSDANKTVRQKCQEYTHVVFDSRSRAYKNPHCAECNHVVNSHRCRRPKSKGPTKGKTLPFSVILKRRFSFEKPKVFKGSRAVRDPTSLKKNSPCPEGQIFDPFFNKCRRLVCVLPGYVVRGRNCVKED